MTKEETIAAAKRMQRTATFLVLRADHRIYGMDPMDELSYSDATDQQERAVELLRDAEAVLVEVSK